MQAAAPGCAAAGTQGAAQPCLCAALAHYRLQRMQGEVYSGIKVGDISLTAGSGQQSEAMVLEMVGDLLDSAGVCVQGVDVCSRNR